jgi:hypothetical protein
MARGSGVTHRWLAPLPRRVQSPRQAADLRVRCLSAPEIGQLGDDLDRHPTHLSSSLLVIRLGSPRSVSGGRPDTSRRRHERAGHEGFSGL